MKDHSIGKKVVIGLLVTGVLILLAQVLFGLPG